MTEATKQAVLEAADRYAKALRSGDDSAEPAADLDEALGRWTPLNRQDKEAKAFLEGTLEPLDEQGDGTLTEEQLADDIDVTIAFMDPEF